jgi:Protein of unknown function (DUF2591)
VDGSDKGNAVKHKVCELEGALLDAAVAKAEAGLNFLPEGTGYHFDNGSVVGFFGVAFLPSSSWEDGGPIIERERIALIPPEPVVSVEVERAAGMQPGPWLSWQWGDPARRMSQGPKPLTAAMRAHVASRFGQEVELP